ncbi:MAG: DUF1579 family protein [Phycisphaerales bacterium]|nr:DUF1579 family protein [Phycisphaerales bacterium]
MTSLRGTFVLLFGVTALALTGCGEKKGGEMNMEEMKVERPAALDRLNDFVGTWKGEYTMHIKGMDEPMKCTGTSEMSWDCEKWVLVEHSNFSMGENGTFTGHGMWTYDAKSDKFYTFWADSMGSRGTGVAKYDADEDEWDFHGKSVSPQGTTYGKGEMTLRDGTMKWSWSESAMFGLIKVFDMEGESHKM